MLHRPDCVVLVEQREGPANDTATSKRRCGYHHPDELEARVFILNNRLLIVFLRVVCGGHAKWRFC